MGDSQDLNAVLDQKLENEGAGTPPDKEPQAAEGQKDPAPSSTPPETQAPVKKFKVKLDGREEEVEEEELVKNYQLSKVSYQKLQEAAQVKKEAQFSLDMVDKDLHRAVRNSLLRQAGGDQAKAEALLKDFGVQIVQKFFDREAETPQERAARESREQLKAEEERLKKEREEFLALKRGEEEKAFQADLDLKLPEAMKKAGLPADNDKVKLRVLQYYDLLLSHGIDKEGSLEQCAREVKRERLQAARELSKTLNEDELKELFPEQYNKARSKEIEEVRKGGTSTPKPSTRKDEATSPGRAKTSKRITSWSELSRTIDERLGTDEIPIA